MDKKEYLCPELDYFAIHIQDVIMASPENFSGYLDDGNNDWGDPPPFDDDDDIQW